MNAVQSRDGQICRGCVYNYLGAPAGTAIYFAGDTDASQLYIMASPNCRGRLAY